MRKVSARLAMVLTGLAAVGCGGGSASKPGGTGGNGPGGATGEISRPCPDTTHVGAFELTVVAPTATVVGYAQLIGTVQDRANPGKIWSAAATQGDCRLMVGPTCSATCALPDLCAGATCVPGPVTKTVGTVTLSGLSASISATPNSQKNYYAPVSAAAFPSFGPGADLKLAASGGDYAAFELRGRGFPLVETPATMLPFEKGKPFSLTWTPPPSPSATRMFVKIDIAFHGGVDAQIQCDLPDSGSASVPAALVDALLERGVAGFPSAFLVRRTVDSVNVGAGCVDFAITNSFNGTTGIQLSIPGVTSCNEDSDCAGEMTCGGDLKCR
jgi:hypothetical protein